jgi:hypothetical protein
VYFRIVRHFQQFAFLRLSNGFPKTVFVDAHLFQWQRSNLGRDLCLSNLAHSSIVHRFCRFVFPSLSKSCVKNVSAVVHRFRQSPSTLALDLPLLNGVSFRIVPHFRQCAFLPLSSDSVMSVSRAVRLSLKSYVNLVLGFAILDAMFLLVVLHFRPVTFLPLFALDLVWGQVGIQEAANREALRRAPSGARIGFDVHRIVLARALKASPLAWFCLAFWRVKPLCRMDRFRSASSATPS